MRRSSAFSRRSNGCIIVRLLVLLLLMMMVVLGHISSVCLRLRLRKWWLLRIVAVIVGHCPDRTHGSISSFRMRGENGRFHGLQCGRFATIIRGHWVLPCWRQ